MKWFDGSIQEAISLAQHKDGIFAVFVCDQSDESKEVEGILENPDILSLLSADPFVIIRLENGSPESLQFSQIYPIVILPSLFLIKAKTGLPQEIIGGKLEKAEFLEKIRSVQTDLKKTDDQGPCSSSNSIEEEPTVPVEEKAAEASSLTREEEKSSKVEEGSGLSNDPSAPLTVSSASTDDAAALEDKLRHAQEVIKLEQEKKDEQLKKEEKEKEVFRRTLGQNMNKNLKEKNDQEMSLLAAQRKKAKEDDRKARERVKSQIAADRADREARTAIFKGEDQKNVQANPSPAVADQRVNHAGQGANGTTRIKFRYPDNSSGLGVFNCDDCLSLLVDHVRTTSNGIDQFSLSSLVHQKRYSDEDMGKSLSDLGLTPSAIVLVTPRTKNSPLNIVPKNFSPTDWFWTLLSPFTSILFYIGSIFGLTGESNGNREASSSGDRAPDAKRPRLDRDGLRNRRTPARQEGNIHRLDRGSEDDDENNTWNGNSTQQM